MLINTEWSTSKPIEYGKNIRITSSLGDLTASIFNATGVEISKYLSPLAKEIEFHFPEIAHINLQMLRFKTQTGERHVRFEQF